MAADLSEEQVVRHLLFHKALLSEDDAGARINRYLDIVRSSKEGEHVSITDPVDRAIALAFELVMQEHLDPWAIDLVQFAALYTRRLRENPEVDLITAGRLLYMAWSILRMQSDALVRRAEPPPPPPEPEPDPWMGVEAAGDDDPDSRYTLTVLGADGAPIDEKVRHRGDRRVTFLELLDALEEARGEADLRAQLADLREAERRKRTAQRSERVEGQVHKEDQERDIQEIWGRIASLNGHPIPLQEIQGRSREDLVKTLVSVLFLARSNRIRIWQEDFPFGTIFVQNPAPAPKAAVALEPHPN